MRRGVKGKYSVNKLFGFAFFFQSGKTGILKEGETEKSKLITWGKEKIIDDSQRQERGKKFKEMSKVE